jgi:branched-chain amino acid transport system substrate-binding protein
MLWVGGGILLHGLEELAILKPLTDTVEAAAHHAAAAAGAFAATEGVFAPAIAQNKPIKIGILAPRSGIAAAPGLNGIRATEWAVERYNKNGGIGGRKVELVIEEESSPKDTIERFSKLVQQEKVDCVQGIVSSGVGLALGPVVEEA